MTAPAVPPPLLSRRPLRLAARAAFAAALAFVLFFSLYPHDAVDATFSRETQSLDWLFHSVCYAALPLLLLAGHARAPLPLLRRLDAALLFAALGCALELAQALLPFVARSCTLSDARSNALGALLGALLLPARLLPPAPSR